MNSPGHRANILKPAYREIGIGIVAGNPARTDGAGATYATTFGVIETAPVAAPAQVAKTSKAARKRKRGKRRGSRAKVARKASASRHHGRGKGERRAHKRRGPTARISV